MRCSSLYEKIPFLLLMSGIGLLLLGAVATCETEVELNLHTGKYRVGRTIFRIVPLWETTTFCTWFRN